MLTLQVSWTRDQARIFAWLHTLATDNPNPYYRIGTSPERIFGQLS